MLLSNSDSLHWAYAQSFKDKQIPRTFSSICHSICSHRKQSLFIFSFYKSKPSLNDEKNTKAFPFTTFHFFSSIISFKTLLSLQIEMSKMLVQIWQLSFQLLPFVIFKCVQAIQSKLVFSTIAAFATLIMSEAQQICNKTLQTKNDSLHQRWRHSERGTNIDWVNAAPWTDERVIGGEIPWTQCGHNWIRRLVAADRIEEME